MLSILTPTIPLRTLGILVAGKKKFRFRFSVIDKNPPCHVFRRCAVDPIKLRFLSAYRESHN